MDECESDYVKAFSVHLRCFSYVVMRLVFFRGSTLVQVTLRALL